jgi:hypothetical protein
VLLTATPCYMYPSEVTSPPPSPLTPELISSTLHLTSSSHLTLTSHPCLCQVLTPQQQVYCGVHLTPLGTRLASHITSPHLYFFPALGPGTPLSTHLSPSPLTLACSSVHCSRYSRKGYLTLLAPLSPWVII